MSIINKLGDTLTVVFNSSNSYSATLSLFPEIKNQKYFRAISNLVTLVSCDFSITGYNVDSLGALTTVKQILVGAPIYFTKLRISMSPSRSAPLRKPGNASKKASRRHASRTRRL